MAVTTATTLLAAFLAALNSVNAHAIDTLDARTQACGPLGVMNLTAIPMNIDTSRVRQCAEHPEGSLISSMALNKRACHFGDTYGCSNNGFCWKSCGQPGSGQWCWTAEDQGFGAWKTCKSKADCAGGTAACGVSPGKECKTCGCSC